MSDLNMHISLKKISLFIIVLYFIIAFLVYQGIIAHNHEKVVNTNGLSTHSLSHLLGTNFNGQDILQRTLFATKSTISFAFFVAFFASFFGSFLGIVSGYYKSKLLDTLIVWFFTYIDSLPFYLFLLILSASKNYNHLSSMLLILYLWTSSCKVIRIKIHEIKNKDYIASSKALGANKASLFLRNMLPNIKYLIFQDFCLVFSLAVKYETILSFLGLRGNEITWGVMLAESAEEIPIGFYQNFIAAGSFLTILLLALNIFNDQLQNEFKYRF